MILFLENKWLVDGFLIVSFIFIEFLNRLKNFVKFEKMVFFCKCFFSLFLMVCDFCILDWNYNFYYGKYGSYMLCYLFLLEIFRGGIG